MTSFNTGFKAGKEDGLGPNFDIGDTCDNYNYTSCSAGYVAGWNTTCKIGTANFIQSYIDFARNKTKR
jgi:hypothetical protein